MAWREWHAANTGPRGQLTKSIGFLWSPRKHARAGAFRQEKTPTESSWGFSIGGGGGNRTRVRKPSTGSTTCLA